MATVYSRVESNWHNCKLLYTDPTWRGPCSRGNAASLLRKICSSLVWYATCRIAFVLHVIKTDKCWWNIFGTFWGSPKWAKWVSSDGTQAVPGKQREGKQTGKTQPGPTWEDKQQKYWRNATGKHASHCFNVWVTFCTWCSRFQAVSMAWNIFGYFLNHNQFTWYISGLILSCDNLMKKLYLEEND